MAMKCFPFQEQQLHNFTQLFRCNIVLLLRCSLIFPALHGFQIYSLIFYGIFVKIFIHVTEAIVKNDPLVFMRKNGSEYS